MRIALNLKGVSYASAIGAMPTQLPVFDIGSRFLLTNAQFRAAWAEHINALGALI
jgi:hypothetical protein